MFSPKTALAKAEADEFTGKHIPRAYTMRYCAHCEVDAAYPETAVRCTLCGKNLT